VAAITYPTDDPWVRARPVLPAWPYLPPRVAGLDGARRVEVGLDRPDAGVYRRRRAVALVALVIVALMTVVGARVVLAGPAGGALTSSRSAGITAVPKEGQAYVVQPGDSLWSIVAAMGGHGDPRPEVDRLADELAGRQLEPGQRITIP
jgi:hypothetical protein